MWQNIRRKICLFLVILTFLSFLVLMVLAQVSNTMLSLNQLVTKTGMRREKRFPNATLVVIMTNPHIYYPNATTSSTEVSYTMENCTLNELQRQGSTHTPTKVNNLHLYNAQHTSFAFFEAPKIAKIGYMLQFVCPPKDPQPFYQTGIVAKSLDVFLQELNNAKPGLDSAEGDISGGYEYVVNQIGVNPIYIEPSSMTFIGMIRQEYYKEKKLESTIFSLKTSAVEIRDYNVGYLVVLYEWQNDYVYTFESYQDTNYVSLIIVICTAVLAVERAIAFVNRVTKQSEDNAVAHQNVFPEKNMNDINLNLSITPTTPTS